MTRKRVYSPNKLQGFYWCMVYGPNIVVDLVLKVGVVEFRSPLKALRAHTHTHTICLPIHICICTYMMYMYTYVHIYIYMRTNKQTDRHIDR